ncbi:hypothetical protein PV325_008956, partial [Microctonus aethiopoides]
MAEAFEKELCVDAVGGSCIGRMVGVGVLFLNMGHGMPTHPTILQLSDFAETWAFFSIHRNR